MRMIMLPMDRRVDEYDIVQTPKGMLASDLPAKIKLDKPFEVNGQMYVCEKYGDEVMGLSEVENGKSKSPTMCKSLYVVRKL
ncbi:hypothetical protein OCOL_000648 [Ordospora colligata]